MVRLLRGFYVAPTHTSQSTDMTMVTPMGRPLHHHRSLQASTRRMMNMYPKPPLHATSPQAVLASGQTPTHHSTVTQRPLGLRSFRLPRRSHASAHLRPQGGRGASRIAHGHALRLMKFTTKGPCKMPPSAMVLWRLREHHCSPRLHRSIPTRKTRTAATIMARAGMAIHTGP